MQIELGCNNRHYRTLHAAKITWYRLPQTVSSVGEKMVRRNLVFTVNLLTYGRILNDICRSLLCGEANVIINVMYCRPRISETSIEIIPWHQRRHRYSLVGINNWIPNSIIYQCNPNSGHKICCAGMESGGLRGHMDVLECSIKSCTLKPLTQSHLSRQYNCWSLRCSSNTACRRCSNSIFILDFTPGVNALYRNNFKTKRKAMKFWELVPLILESWR